MSVQFGGGTKTKPQTTTQTRNVAPMSAQESLLNTINQAVAQQQAQELQRAMQAQQQYEASPLFGQLQGLQGQAATNLQGVMSGQQLINPAQQQALQQYYQSIMAPQLAQMQQTASQEAARRGMTISDSPIGGDYLRQLANYNAQMGGQQAGSALQLGQQNQNLYQNVLNFGQQLQQNAAQNRLALSQAQPGSYSFGNQLAQQRIQSAPVTTTTTGGATSRAPSFGFGLGDTIGAAQAGLNLWSGSGSKDVGTRPLSELFTSKKPATAATPAPVTALPASWWGDYL